jgi:hypothetical protein
MEFILIEEFLYKIKIHGKTMFYHNGQHQVI